MNRDEIKNYLPHREPMLLVDEVNLAEETGDDGTTTACVYGKYTVKGDEYFLQGHFPGYPVVPGVILCEMMAQSCALLLGDEIKGKRTFYTGIDNVRFKTPVRPLDTVCIKAHIINRRKNIIFVEAEAKVNDEKLCCKGDLSFALV